MKQLAYVLKKFQNQIVNPIIVKELRSRMRGARAFITLTGVLILMAIISYGLYQLVIITSTWNYTPLSPQIGQTLFASLAVLEMLMICMITPAVTAGAISSEHEKLTYEMLLTTPLKPTRILWGKLVSALGYVFLLVFAAIPMASLIFIYGGVAPRDMLKALIVLISTAIMLGTIGIFMSTWLKRSGRATIASYLIVLGLLGVPTVIYGIVGVIRQAEPPRWLLVASPINALFSAIAPSTALGNSAMSLIGSLSMLLGGNLGPMLSADSIPRPLYHYTLPLYGVTTLVLYLLATRLIRPARQWRLNFKEIIIGLASIATFLSVIGVGFAVSMDRYENVSIFAAPTPFIPMPVEPMVEPALMLPVSDQEVVSIFTAALQTINQDDLLSDLDHVAISRQTYLEPSAPEISQDSDTAGLLLSNNITEGVTISADDLPFDVIWVDNFEVGYIQEEDNPGKTRDVLIIFSNLNPLKTGLIKLSATVYFTDLSSQNFTFEVANQNGPWQVINFERAQEIPINPEAERRDLHLTFEDMAEIYAAAVEQAYVVDNPLPEAETTEFYLLQSTGLAVDSIKLSPEVQTGISDALANMPFKVFWVENRDDISIEDTTDFYNGGAAIVTFGYILPHNEGEAVKVMIEVNFGEGNGILVTYILEKVDGEWKITEFGGMG